MLRCLFWHGKMKYDFALGWVGFGFCRYSFKKTSMTFLWVWRLRLGIFEILKWQTKGFDKLKRESDLAWDKKWKESGYKTDPKKGGEII